MPMTRRRKLLVAGVTVAALAVNLALPAVHWRLYGGARGEPFYQGRPASYWSAEIAACDAWVVPTMCAMVVADEPFRGPKMVLTRRLNPLDRARLWLAEKLNRPLLAPDDSWRLADDDPAVLPVLVALLKEPSPQVRYFAGQRIGALHEAGRPALPNLRMLADDRAEVFPGLSVAHAVLHPIYMLEKDEAVSAAVHDATPQTAVNPDPPDRP